MTVKQFFKSKTFVCIVVLLCIALVAGGLLAIMNDLLNVSDEERVQRTIKKIYGNEMEYEVVYDINDKNYKDVKYEYSDNGKLYGIIENVYYLKTEGNYLVKATGKQGYHSGSVSIWCVANFSGETFVGINNVSIADSKGQTLMSKFTADVLARFGGTEKNEVAVSGATFSATACNNAVNAVFAYVTSDLQQGGNGND